MNDILHAIITEKKRSVSLRKNDLPVEKIKAGLNSIEKQRDFKYMLSRKTGINIIAEIKKASPSAGIIAKNFNVAKIAKEYSQGNAAAISVLTEEKYFLGDISYINLVKDNSELPVLRKDFIIDEYQIFESKYFNADAILLIAAVLDAKLISEYIKISKNIGLDCLVEVHNEEELDSVLSTPAEIIGINNRNLKSFEVDLNTSLMLAAKIPKNKIIVIESGIKSKNDINIYQKNDINSFLIGEALMRSNNISITLKSFLGD